MKNPHKTTNKTSVFFNMHLKYRLAYIQTYSHIEKGENNKQVVAL